MTEIIALYILMEHSATIYQLKKLIESEFFPFVTLSFGTLHPAIKKLEKNNFIKTRSGRTSGGQKNLTLTITKEGREYFKELMLSELSKNHHQCIHQAEIRLIALSILDKEEKAKVLKKISKLLEQVLIELNNIN